MRASSRGCGEASIRPIPNGHGPHPLVFDSVQKFQWREPQAKDAPRLPDRWSFSLRGPANVVLDISDGMIADLVRVDADTKSVGKNRLSAGLF